MSGLARISALRAELEARVDFLEVVERFLRDAEDMGFPVAVAEREGAFELRFGLGAVPGGAAVPCDQDPRPDPELQARALAAAGALIDDAMQAAEVRQGDEPVGRAAVEIPAGPPAPDPEEDQAGRRLADRREGLGGKVPGNACEKRGLGERQLSPPAPVAGGAGTRGKNFSAPQWTAEEDALAVEMRAKGVSFGAIAAELGRTEQAVNVRCYTRLKARIALAREAAARPIAAAPARPPAVEPPPLSSAPSRAPDLETPIWLRELRAHLDALGHSAPWSPWADFELVRHLSQGRKAAEVAQIMELEKDQVVARFRALCPESSIEAQARLLKELERRAEGAAIGAGVRL